MIEITKLLGERVRLVYSYIFLMKCPIYSINKESDVFFRRLSD